MEGQLREIKQDDIWSHTENFIITRSLAYCIHEQNLNFMSIIILIVIICSYDINMPPLYPRTLFSNNRSRNLNKAHFEYNSFSFVHLMVNEGLVNFHSFLQVNCSDAYEKTRKTFW